MIQRPTRAERLDHALDDLLAGATPAAAAAGAGVTDADRPLLATAGRLREQLSTSLVAPRFEARLGARLSISPVAVDPAASRSADRDRRGRIGGGGGSDGIRRLARSAAPRAASAGAPVGGGTRLPIKFPFSRRAAPSDAWTKCPSCDAQVFSRQLERGLRLCPSCGHHFRMSVGERIDMLLDAGTFQERDAGLESVDRLGFHDAQPYSDRLEAARIKTGLRDAVVWGSARSRAGGLPSASSTSASWAAAWEAWSVRSWRAASRRLSPSGSPPSWSAPREARACRRGRCP